MRATALRLYAVSLAADRTQVDIHQHFPCENIRGTARVSTPTQHIALLI
ncbi:hypothetical protein KOR42_55450 [Thalassoglobus neptunius]|uniref:Uncharacterized protein n=1 Tax=Thalassoglobus neptunius TaxID=1938619 RepID=A0A5C5US62_9PLAN|nr:hypothetical protein KOR42_55450 [Thalassoglobus neptunius]